MSYFFKILFLIVSFSAKYLACLVDRDPRLVVRAWSEVLDEDAGRVLEVIKSVSEVSDLCRLLVSEAGDLNSPYPGSRGPPSSRQGRPASATRPRSRDCSQGWG